MDNIEQIDNEIKLLQSKRRSIVASQKMKNNHRKLEEMRKDTSTHWVLKNLILQRKYLGLSQQEIADKINVTRQTISGAERGVINPSFNTFLEWNEALKFYFFEPRLLPDFEYFYNNEITKNHKDINENNY